MKSADVEDARLNQEADARTNQRTQPLPAVAQDAAAIASLRRQWADMPMIPCIMGDRQEGTDNSWSGFDVRTLLIGEESAGRFTFHDIVVAPGAELSAYHLEHADTYWVVLEGELEVTVGRLTEIMKSDAFAFVPEHTTQALHNRSAAPARLVMWHSPAGVERAFARAHQQWISNPDASAADYELALSAFGFHFHRQDQRLPNDERTNAPVARLEYPVETFDDYAAMRSQWTRRAPVPKLLHDRRLGGDIPMAGQETKVLLSGDEGSGRCVVFFYGIEPGYVAPLHHQPSEEEIFIVLDGPLRLTVGNVTRQVTRGSFGFVPRYGTHGFLNPTKDSLARTITINSPAGHERGFEMIVREGASESLPQLLVAHGWHLHGDYEPEAP